MLNTLPTVECLEEVYLGHLSMNFSLKHKRITSPGLSVWDSVDIKGELMSHLSTVRTWHVDWDKCNPSSVETQVNTDLVQDLWNSEGPMSSSNQDDPREVMRRKNVGHMYEVFDEDQQGWLYIKYEGNDNWWAFIDEV
jgi:hypothetical protein